MKWKIVLLIIIKKNMSITDIPIQYFNYNNNTISKKDIDLFPLNIISYKEVEDQKYEISFVFFLI